MASNLRRSRRTFSQRFLTVEQRVANLRRRPVPVRIGARVVLGNNIAPGSITPPAFSDSVATYVQETAIPGNTIYYTTTAPPGSDYAEGDLWFDSDNDYRLSRWNGTSWELFGLGTAAFSTIDAGKITTGVLNAIQLTGNAISGGTIRIGSGSNVFSADSNGLYLGSTTFASAPFSVTPAGYLKATIGEFSGTLSSGVSITSPVISGGSISGTSISIGSPVAFQVTSVGAMTASSATITGGSLNINSSFIVSTTGVVTATAFNTGLSGERVELGTNYGSGDEIRFISSGGGVGSIRNPSGASLRLSASTTTIDVNSSGLVFSGTAAGLYVGGAGGGALLVLPSNYVRSQLIYDTTIGSAANMFIGSNYTIYRSTSSIKYKTDVEDLWSSYAEKVLDLRPVWFRSLCKDDPKDHSYYGFIAEEVAEIDPRLVHWGKDEDGNPTPEGVQYDRLVPHLVHLIKDLRARVEQLESAAA